MHTQCFRIYLQRVQDTYAHNEYTSIHYTIWDNLAIWEQFNGPNVRMRY